MKKSLIVIAALILAMSVAGCGKKTENTNTTPQQTAQADASGAYENGSATETLDGQDYSKNVDMAAVEGTEAKSDTKADSYSGEVSNNDISIEEAKLINYDDSDVVVVSFEFTNKTDSDQSFSGVYDVIAEQNGSSLAPATVIGVDGVELLTLSQNIAPGEQFSRFLQTTNHSLQRHLISKTNKKYLCTMQRYFLLCFNNHIFTVNFASVQQFIGTFKKNIIDFTAITFDNSERHRNVNIVIFINKIFIFDSFS